MRSPLNTTRDDLIGVLRASLAVTPPRSQTLDRIDEALRSAIGLRANSPTPQRHNDLSEAIEKMFEARALVAGNERPPLRLVQGGDR